MGDAARVKDRVRQHRERIKSNPIKHAAQLSKDADRKIKERQQAKDR